jgi:L-amino acid N-acyltransferase YncA
LLAIYRPFVETTAVSFEMTAPSVEEFAARIAKAVAGWQWLVAERDGECIGYPYGSSHRERPAYRWSVEVSAYVHAGCRRQGVASELCARLFEQLAHKGFCNAYAGISLPNEGSVALHRRVGFEPIGVFKAVGRKFDAWHDVAWFHLALRESPPAGEAAAFQSSAGRDIPQRAAASQPRSPMKPIEPAADARDIGLMPRFVFGPSRVAAGALP